MKDGFGPNSATTESVIMLDLNRLNRVHVVNVRFDNSNKKYLATLKDPSDNSLFEIDWNIWITYGDWQQRKSENNHY